MLLWNEYTTKVQNDVLSAYLFSFCGKQEYALYVYYFTVLQLSLTFSTFSYINYVAGAASSNK